MQTPSASTDPATTIQMAATDPYPIGDWRYEVSNGDTQRGYADWRAARLEQDGSPPELNAVDNWLIFYGEINYLILNGHYSSVYSDDIAYDTLVELLTKSGIPVQIADGWALFRDRLGDKPDSEGFMLNEWITSEGTDFLEPYRTEMHSTVTAQLIGASGQVAQARQPASREQIEAARETWQTNELQIDDDALIAPLDEDPLDNPHQSAGYWIQSWLYCEPPDADTSEPES